ncbi:MAG: hypothetical protein A2Y73_07990 [Chloroflexi bacterium RBG_13_56_8]|nr:MAG: hypothetical protein A2Y73_07990 [Chloroflexi bacterium RBG_13_56_8]
MQVKSQEYPMHEPRFKRGMAIGYALSPTGADHCHSLHDSGLGTATEEGFMPSAPLRSMGILEPMSVEDLGLQKVRASIAHATAQIMKNCLSMCQFVAWSLNDYVEIVKAATGFDMTAYELVLAGERAMTLARVFNMREGFSVKDDRLAERSYGPTRNGVLADGGIDREELQEAVQIYYGIMGWDRETGVPTLGKLQELDVAWAAEYLPK